jgi:hypothetical protein
MTINNTPPVNQPAPPPDDPINSALRDVNYNSLEEWKNSTHSSRREGKRLAEALAARDARVAELEAALNDRMLPSQARAARDPGAELASFVPVDALEQYVNDRVTRGIESTIGPIVKTNAALSRVKTAIPDFARFETDWNTWLQTHPEVNRRLQDALLQSPDSADLAIAGAYSAFEREQRANAQPPAPPPVPSSASLPPAQGSAAGRSGELAMGPSPEEIAALLARARRGDDRAKIDLMKMRLGNRPNPELPQL